MGNSLSVIDDREYPDQLHFQHFPMTRGFYHVSKFQNGFLCNIRTGLFQPVG